MDPNRLQAIIAGLGLLGALVLGWMTLETRVSRLEERMASVETAQIDDRSVMTAEVIELMKLVHQLRGRAHVLTEQKGAQ